MSTIVYRKLEFHVARLLGTIDRSERIDATYRATNGSLELVVKQQEVLSWDGAELTEPVDSHHPAET